MWKISRDVSVPVDVKDIYVGSFAPINLFPLSVLESEYL